MWNKRIYFIESNQPVNTNELFTLFDKEHLLVVVVVVLVLVVVVVLVLAVVVVLEVVVVEEVGSWCSCSYSGESCDSCWCRSFLVSK